jgi:hypothetical protein
MRAFCLQIRFQTDLSGALYGHQRFYLQVALKHTNITEDLLAVCFFLLS